MTLPVDYCCRGSMAQRTHYIDSTGTTSLMAGHVDNAITQFFSTENFMPHGHCYLWEPALLWLHVVSDGLIALAYCSIPITLLFFVQKRKDLQFHWIFVCFAVFILACGASHVMEIRTVWIPDYWVSGIIKAITAIASIATAYLLARLMPLALAIPSPSAMAASNDLLRREIADRTRIEAVLEDKNIELVLLNNELSAFSYSVSHDLRAPLRRMDGFSLVLLEDYADHLPPDAKSALERIRLASQQMGRLIDDLLRLSQVTSVDIRIGRVDLSAMCTNIATTLQDTAPARPVQWHIMQGMQIDADLPLIQIALQNLIENAWKFTGRTAAPSISIGSKEVDGETVYFVGDNGAGFDMSHADKLFSTFERLHSTADFQGTGIGLALVSRIIARHKGKIWSEAAVGRGATFYFCMKDQNHVAAI